MLENAGFRILKMEVYDEKSGNGYAFGYSPAKKEFVTWGVTRDGGSFSFYWGHYINDRAKALKDYHERLANEYARMEG